MQLLRWRPGGHHCINQIILILARAKEVIHFLKISTDKVKELVHQLRLLHFRDVYYNPLSQLLSSILLRCAHFFRMEALADMYPPN